MSFRRLFLLLITFFALPAAVANNLLVYFEPEEVELYGLVRNLKFPGPPNYESIKNDDADETGPYLILNNPIDIKTVPKIQIGNDALEKNVKLIQLVVHNDNDWPKLKEGNYVKARGTLFHALSAHHHARILLTIKQIKIQPAPRTTSKNKLDITADDQRFLDHEHLLD